MEKGTFEYDFVRHLYYLWVTGSLYTVSASFGNEKKMLKVPVR